MTIDELRTLRGLSMTKLCDAAGLSMGAIFRLTRPGADITGGLAGAWFGFSAIPARWVDALAPGLRQDLDILAAAAESHRNK